MNYYHLTNEQLEWKERVAELAEREIAPRAAEYDAKAQFPKESLDALGQLGLWALRVDKEHGGLGGDMVTTCLIVEEIAKKCPLYCHVLQDAPGISGSSQPHTNGVAVEAVRRTTCKRRGLRRRCRWRISWAVGQGLAASVRA